jgi:cephalosporin-C deacetylase-like acetyl esterase
MSKAFEFSRQQLKSVKPSMAYSGQALSKWQTEAREKLCELLGFDTFVKIAPELEIEYEGKIDGATEIRFSFQSEENYRVPCVMLLPDGIEKPPVMICLQGHSTGMHISLGRAVYEGDEDLISGGDRDFCVRAVKEGWAAIAVEQRGFGETRMWDVEGGGCRNTSMMSILMGRTTIGERVWDVSRLIDVLEMSFSDKLDLSRLSCMGNSGGGTVTAYLGALEDRLKLVMPSCAMCQFSQSIAAMQHCTCNYVPNIAKFFDMGDLMAMACPKYFVQVSGETDCGFLLPGSTAVFEAGKQAYEKAGVTDRCSLIIGNGGHRFFADDAWPVVHQYLG